MVGGGGGGVHAVERRVREVCVFGVCEDKIMGERKDKERAKEGDCSRKGEDGKSGRQSSWGGGLTLTRTPMTSTCNTEMHCVWMLQTCVA